MNLGDYHLVHMKLSCIICQRKNDRGLGHTLYNPGENTFDRFELEDHLRKNHTIDELLRELTERHWDAMIPRLEPNEQFRKEYSLDFKPKKRRKSKK